MTVRKVYPDEIATEIGQPDFSHLIQLMIYDQEHPDSNSDITHISLTALPTFYGKISIYPSAVATFYAPSDICGAGGMRSERIRAVTSWRNGASRFDTVFVSTDPTAEGMRGLDVARVQLSSRSHMKACYIHVPSCIGTHARVTLQTTPQACG